ncbi:MAG: M64 family metallopeptidase [Bdellovibrionota bacterium]
MKWFLLSLFVVTLCFANPYPKESEVPKDSPADYFRHYPEPNRVKAAEGIEVLRVDVSWKEGEVYEVSKVVRELSGTSGLMARATQNDPHGSYQGRLIEPFTQSVMGQDSLGTGMLFRRLTRGFSFRFPLPQSAVEFQLVAENPDSGEMETVLSQRIEPSQLAPATPESPAGLEVRALKQATVQPQIRVNFYAEGYLASRKDRFWQDAQKAVNALSENNFPGFSQMSFYAVFYPSNKALGSAKDLGLPVEERDSFLGLYFPYWEKFGRWYHVLYPTRVSKYRDGIGLVPYDYPVILVDDSNYWGVGNFRELTAVPTGSWSFTYLLLHEMGHFFGLNEEYESGGPTELSFAPEIEEPWSQNITFLRDPQGLKWKEFVASSTPIPTPASQWTSGKYGAYKGGYAQSVPENTSHKPGIGCVMASQGNFCAICKHAIEARVQFDSGKSPFISDSEAPASILAHRR